MKSSRGRKFESIEIALLIGKDLSGQGSDIEPILEIQINDHEVV